MDPPPPPSPASHRDRTTQVYASTWTLTILALCFLSLRLWCKTYRHSLGWRLDDWLLIVSFAAMLVGVSFLTAAFASGFGASAYPSRSGTTQFQVLISMAAVAAAWTKTGFAATVWGITTKRWARWVLGVGVLALNGIMLTYALVAWIKTCGIPGGFGGVTLPVPCWSSEQITAISYGAAAYSGFLDLVLALWPWPIIWKLDIGKTEKLGIAVAMSAGLLAFVAVIVRFVVLQKVPTSTDTVELYSLLAMTFVAEPALSIVGQSIPVFRVLLRGSRASRYCTDHDQSHDYERVTPDQLDRQIIAAQGDYPGVDLELIVGPGGRVMPAPKKGDAGDGREGIVREGEVRSYVT